MMGISGISVGFGLAILVAGIGHAVLWTALLNHLYGRPLPKSFLRWWRYTTAVIIAAYPIAIGYQFWTASGLFLELGTFPDSFLDLVLPLVSAEAWKRPPLPLLVTGYVCVCLVMGGIVFPWITWKRWQRRPPSCLRDERSHHYDFWKQDGRLLLGDGSMRWAARLPGNEIFRLEITEQTLSLPRLPAVLHGLHLLVLSDFHFHGTPSRRWFEQVITTLRGGPCPDLVCLLGDYVDRHDHRAWIVPLLGEIPTRFGKLAILGNHDVFHDPDQIRASLRAAGCLVLRPQWQVITVRDEPLAVIAHEGPWLQGPSEEADLQPPSAFRLGLSHTPDNFYWAIRQQVDLLLCGHVHGGQIRLPWIGPIFVPSIYGRRFDTGVFQVDRTVMAVCRGLSGKEPLRFRCKPQILRITLTCDNREDR
jgi:predicted MPP superfamily phosphohydrolase